MWGGQFRFVQLYTAAGEKIAMKHMLPAVHSIYLATSSADDARREDKREVAGRGANESEGTPFVLSRSDRKSGADIIPKRAHPNLYVSRTVHVKCTIYVCW